MARSALWLSAFAWTAASAFVLPACTQEPASQGSDFPAMAGGGMAAIGAGGVAGMQMPIAGSNGIGTAGMGVAGTTVAGMGAAGGAGMAAAGTSEPMAGSSAAGSSGAGSGGAAGSMMAGAGGMAGSAGSSAAGSGSGGGATFTEVYAVISASCGGGFSGCHITGSSGQLRMPDKATAYTNLVGKPSSECTGETRVIEGDADGSVLVTAIEGTACVDPMPRGRDPLSAADIMKFRAWIDAGALNN